MTSKTQRPKCVRCGKAVTVTKDAIYVGGEGWMHLDCRTEHERLRYGGYMTKGY